MPGRISQTPIDGLLLSKVATTPAAPEYSLTEPLLVVMAQGGKRLLLGDQMLRIRSRRLSRRHREPAGYRPLDRHGQKRAGAGHGRWCCVRPPSPRYLLQVPPGRWSRGTPAVPAIATGKASPELLDAAARMLRLLDHPADAAVLAPLITQEIFWRLLAGPLGDTMRQIGLADSDLTHVSRAIAWIRDNYAQPMRIDDLARLSGMSASAFHRHFRAVTAMSPLQFQKRIRLQHARSLLVAHPGDIAGVGHQVGYDSPSQFNREYRRLFGAPPGQDAERLRTDAPMTASL